jgi:hypothetical protein
LPYGNKSLEYSDFITANSLPKNEIRGYKDKILISPTIRQTAQSVYTEKKSQE